MNPPRMCSRSAWQLEGGIGALALASGSAAVTYAIRTSCTGDHIVAAKTLYGGTYNLFAHTFKDFAST